MFKLYDTEKELSYNDYISLPELSGLNCTELNDLIYNLYNAIDNAYCYHADLFCAALYDDIVKVNRKRCFDYLLTVSPGHIASLINNTKYSEIDKCISISWQYFNCCDDQIFFDIGTGTENIEKLIQTEYNNAKQQERK